MKYNAYYEYMKILVIHIVNGNKSAQRGKDCIILLNGKQTFIIFGSLCFNCIKSNLRKKFIEDALDIYNISDFNNLYKFIIQWTLFL